MNMENNAKELRKCTRCRSTILLEYFETNRKGELYKSCNNCRGLNMLYKAKSKQPSKEVEEEFEKLYKIIQKIKMKKNEENIL